MKDYCFKDFVANIYIKFINVRVYTNEKNVVLGYCSE